MATSEKAISFFELAARTGSFVSWKAAREHYAAKVGVQLPFTRRSSRVRSKSTGTLGDQLEFVNSGASEVFISQWVRQKNSTTLDTALAAAAQAARWPAKASNKQNVIAFPGFNPNDWTTPTAYVIYRRDGKEFPAVPEKGIGERKSHCVRGSKNSLVVVGGRAAIEAAEVVWLCEGIPDALALAAHLPAGHVAVTNTHGAGAWRAEDGLSPAFAGKRVMIVMDRDAAGVGGAKLRAADLFPVAAEVKIVELPYPVADKHGKDARDFFGEGHTFDELATIAASTPALTAADVEAFNTEQKSPDDGSSRALIVTNAIEFVSEDGSTHIKPQTMQGVLRRIADVTDAWPRRVGDALFVHDGSDKVSWLTSTAATFGWLQSRAGIVDWHNKMGCVTKEEVCAELRRTSQEYLAVENLPHVPPLANHFYACQTPQPGDGSALQELLARFTPATEIDRDLILAAVLTLFWGGAPGGRPGFAFTADAGRGKGKTKCAEMLAHVVGGTVDFSANEDIAQIKTRLLSADSLPKRLALLDNVKSHRFSWAELEGLLTAPTISGKRMYVGEATRPNVLTWFITLNGASLSTDMAQRLVIIKLGEPERSKNWEHDTRAADRRKTGTDCRRLHRQAAGAGD